MYIFWLYRSFVYICFLSHFSSLHVTLYVPYSLVSLCLFVCPIVNLSYVCHSSVCLPPLYALYVLPPYITFQYISLLYVSLPYVPRPYVPCMSFFYMSLLCMSLKCLFSLCLSNITLPDIPQIFLLRMSPYISLLPNISLECSSLVYPSLVCFSSVYPSYLRLLYVPSAYVFLSYVLFSYISCRFFLHMSLFCVFLYIIPPYVPGREEQGWAVLLCNRKSKKPHTCQKRVASSDLRNKC